MIPLVKTVIGPEEKALVNEVLESGMLAQGPKVKQFEELFAQYCGTKFAVAVNNGTSALHAALYAAGVKPGDEVITTPFTFVATANAILMQGATVVFADIDPVSFNLDPAAVEKKITPKTKAILAVDLYGQIYDYDRLRAIANKHKLALIEDAAQAIGAELNGKRAGHFGDITTFSLYATKNMMTGEGGVVTTDNPEYAELVKRFRHHGQSEQTRYQYFDLGYNYRMMDLQAAIGIAQIHKIEDLNNRRIQNAKKLNEGLKQIKGIKTPVVLPGRKHVYHQYTILVEKEFHKSRDDLSQFLKDKGVSNGIYYPIPLHLSPHFRRFGFKEGDFPVAEAVAKKVLSLPIHPLLSHEELDTIVHTMQEAAKQ
jgi:perosamine synthetase